MTTPEGRVKRDIRNFLKTFGPQVRAHWPVQAGYGDRALDVILCVRGRYLEIEVKRPGERVSGLSGYQKLTMQSVTTAGGVTTSVDDVQQVRDLFTMLFPDLKPIPKNVV